MERITRRLDLKSHPDRQCTFRCALREVAQLVGEEVVEEQYGCVEIDLVGLLPGEYLGIAGKGLFRVVSGLAELDGYIFTPALPNFQPLLIPPWQPVERLLSLCFGDAKHFYEIENESIDCAKCNAILTHHLYGGSCCDARQRVRENGQLSGRGDLLDQETRLTEFDAELLNFYKLNANHEGISTIVAFMKCKGAFGTTEPGQLYNSDGAIAIMHRELHTVLQSYLQQFSQFKRAAIMSYGCVGAGKSKLAIHYTNQLLNYFPKVAFVDLDIGQPIVSTQGLISFTMVTRPITTANYSNVAYLKPEFQCQFEGELGGSINCLSYYGEFWGLQSAYSQLSQGRELLRERS